MDFSAILADAGRAAVGEAAIVYALAGIGLNVHFGYTGLLNFGQVGFLLVGAYGVAITVAQFNGPLWLGVIVGILSAVVLALLLGVPTLRLRADYLAITTIAAGEILRLVYRSAYAEPLTGGVFGLQQFADSFYSLNPIPDGSYGVGRFAFSEQGLWLMVVGWALVVISAILVLLLMRSPWGRVLKSIREDEEAARSLGKNVFSYKLQSLVIGGVIGALGGMVLAIANQAVSADTYNPVVTFYTYTVLILGGAGRVIGPIVGSVVFWFLVSGTDTFLRQLVGTSEFVGGMIAATETGAIRFALVGLGLMLLMIYRPEGMFGNRQEMLLDTN